MHINYKNHELRQLVEDDIIFEGVLGSHAYGTNIESSDEDTGGISLLSDKSFYIGSNSFEQLDSFQDENGNKIDRVIYNFVKFIKLASDCNPNIMDYLFLPERCFRKSTKEWEKVLDQRDIFISKKARFTFSGYAYSQLRRIKNHREYLLNPPKKKPERSDFKLPEKSIFPDTQYQAILNISTDYVEQEDRDDFFMEAIQVLDEGLQLVFSKYMTDSMVPIAMQRFRVGQKNFLGMIASIQSKFLKTDYTEMAARELSWFVAKGQYDKYQHWKKNRNPQRQTLEAKCGYDSKHAVHLIRLMRMGTEIMEGKGILVDRTNIDKDELINIRLGNVKFDDILAMHDKLETSMSDLYKASKIRSKVDLEAISNLKMDLIESRLRYK